MQIKKFNNALQRMILRKRKKNSQVVWHVNKLNRSGQMKKKKNSLQKR